MHNTSKSGVKSSWTTLLGITQSTQVYQFPPLGISDVMLSDVPFFRVPITQQSHLARLMSGVNDDDDKNSRNDRM